MGSDPALRVCKCTILFTLPAVKSLLSGRPDRAVLLAVARRRLAAAPRRLVGVSVMPVRPVALQERSRRTQRAILDAAARLLEEQGPEALTIAAVSARANVAGATVYRRFGDKEGLLAAIQAEFTEGIRSEYGRRLSASGLREAASAADAIRLAVRGLAETVRAHEKLLRVFAVLGLRDERVFAVGSRASHQGGRLFRDLLWPYRDEFSGGDPEAAIDTAYRLVYAACMHRVLNGPNLESPTLVTWERLTGELGRAVVLYLLGSVPGRD